MSNNGDLAGVPAQTLQQWLTAAQGALNLLATGQQAVTVTVTGGGQHREVTYNRANMGALRAWIRELKRALGMPVSRGRAIAVSF